MAEPNIELILARSLAAHLAVPAFLADPDGRIVYFNEAAELLVGRSFEDTPDLSSDDLIEILEPRDESGRPLEPEEMPLPSALSTRLPASVATTKAADEGSRHLAVAVPFLDRDGMVLGALLFWYEEKA